MAAMLRKAQCFVNAENAIHDECGFRNNGQMNVVEWLHTALAKPGKTQRGLASALDIDPSAVNRMLKGDRRLRVDEVTKAAAYLGEAIPDELLPVLKPENSATQDWILEVDVKGGAGGGGEAGVCYVSDGNGGMTAADDVKAQWGIPQDYIRSELRVRSDTARMIEIHGDSMEPILRSGDRVMIDMADVKPTPGGIFCIWDGIGVVVKRLEYIPYSDPPAIKIQSENPRHDTYERTADEVKILGRVVWAARRI